MSERPTKEEFTIKLYYYDDEFGETCYDWDIIEEEVEKQIKEITGLDVGVQICE